LDTVAKKTWQEISKPVGLNRNKQAHSLSIHNRQGMSPETFVDVDAVFVIFARFDCDDYRRTRFYLEDDVARPSETPVNFQTIRRHVAESGNLIVVAL